MVFPFLEEERWKNADFLTAPPYAHLSDEDLARLAAQEGVTVAELLKRLATPTIANTCPLCGRPQTHTNMCKGCGGGAWGWEFEEAYGEEAIEQMRTRLREVLSQIEWVSQEQAEQSARHAYTYGGCQICAECWRNTLPYDAYETCPLRVLGQATVAPGWIPEPLLMAALEAPRGRGKTIARQWVEATRLYWTEAWNTVAGPEREAVARWRASILKGAGL